MKLYTEKISGNILKDNYSTNILSCICNLIFALPNMEEVNLNFINISGEWINKFLILSRQIPLIDNDFKLDNNAKYTEQEYQIIDILEVIKIITSSSFDAVNSTTSNEEEKLTLFYLMFKELWPSFKLSMISTKSKIVEGTVQIIKLFMRKITNDFMAYMKEFLSIACTAFTITPFSTYLYCFEVVLTVIAPNCDDDWFNVLKSVYEELTNITFGKYLKSQIMIEDYNELTFDVYGMMFRCMKLNPLIVLDSKNFEEILVISSNLISLKQPNSSLNVIYFLDKVLDFKENKIIKRLDEKTLNFYYSKIYNSISNHGEGILYKIFNYLQESPVSMVLTHLINLSITIIEQFHEKCLEWFISVLQKLPDSCLTNNEKNDTLQTIQLIITELKINPKSNEKRDYTDQYSDFLMLIYNRSISINNNQY